MKKAIFFPAFAAAACCLLASCIRQPIPEDTDTKGTRVSVSKTKQINPAGKGHDVSVPGARPQDQGISSAR